MHQEAETTHTRRAATWPTGRSMEWVVFAAVLLLALVVRLLLLESRWINPDEGPHLMDARLLLDGLVPGLDFDARQVVYVHILAFLVKFTGNDLIYARLLPVLSTLGAGVFLYLIVRRLYGVAVALLSLVLFLFLPFSILMTVNVRTQPLALLFSSGGLFFALRGVQDRDATRWLFVLSGVFLGLGYYVRESTLAVALAVAVLLLAARSRGLLAKIQRLALFASGLLGVLGLVLIYYLGHAPLAAALDLSQNPISFVLDHVQRLEESAQARTGATLFDERWVGPIQEQPYRRAWIFFRGPAYSQFFLLVGAALSLPYFFMGFRERDRQGQLAFWSLAPWLGLLALGYVFWSIQRGFYRPYFLEFLPPLSALTAAVVVTSLARLRDHANPAKDALIVALLLVGFALAYVAGMPDVNRPLYFAVSTLVLGAVYLGSGFRARWWLLAALAALAMAALLFIAPRLPAAAKGLLYAAFACALYLGLFRAARISVRASVPKVASFVSYSLVVSAFTFSVFFSARHLDLAYDNVWSPDTVKRITAVLAREARGGEEVMSGGVIWEFRSGLRPFRNVSHPVGYRQRMSVTEADAIRARLETDPPAFVILDGYTERTYLRRLPEIEELLEDRYELRATVEGSNFPVSVYSLRRAGLTRAGEAAASPAHAITVAHSAPVAQD